MCVKQEVEIDRLGKKIADNHIHIRFEGVNKHEPDVDTFGLA